MIQTYRYQSWNRIYIYQIFNPPEYSIHNDLWVAKEMNNTNEIQPFVDWNFNKIRYISENVCETNRETTETWRKVENSSFTRYPNYQMEFEWCVQELSAQHERSHWKLVDKMYINKFQNRFSQPMRMFCFWSKNDLMIVVS